MKRFLLFFLVAISSSQGAIPVAAASSADSNTPSPASMRAVDDLIVEQLYGPLFTQLGIEGESKAEFKRLLIDRRNQEIKAMADVLPRHTPEELIASATTKVNKLRAVQKESNEAIQKLINNEESFKVFLRWEDSKSEHLELRKLTSRFEETSAPLSKTQQEQLIEVMTAARNSPRAPSVGSPPGTNSFLVRQKAINHYILQNAVPFLSQPQLQTLEQALAEKLARTESLLSKAASK